MRHVLKIVVRREVPHHKRVVEREALLLRMVRAEVEDLEVCNKAVHHGGVVGIAVMSI